MVHRNGGVAVVAELITLIMVTIVKTIMTIKTIMRTIMPIRTIMWADNPTIMDATMTIMPTIMPEDDH